MNLPDACARERSWKACGAVWRDGLCYLHWHEQFAVIEGAGPASRKPSTLNPNGILIKQTPGRQERAVAASLAARKVRA